MNRAFKEAWIAALRDPSAKQGRGCLGLIDGSRCCLGVAADVAGVSKKPMNDTEVLGYAVREDSVLCNTVPAGVSKNPMNDTEVLGYAFREDSVLWNTVPAGWMGLSEDNIGELMGMNDRDGYTFPVIADWIEQYIFATDDV